MNSLFDGFLGHTLAEEAADHADVTDRNDLVGADDGLTVAGLSDPDYTLPIICNDSQRNLCRFKLGSCLLDLPRLIFHDRGEICNFVLQLCNRFCLIFYHSMFCKELIE